MNYKEKLCVLSYSLGNVSAAIIDFKIPVTSEEGSEDRTNYICLLPKRLEEALALTKYLSENV
ncbi:MAG: hypothetical protein LBS19_02285 [Clostridiales bacterium]|jgi:hypothetical protein|nr:hypothetical protein [Clostridiales bacterium]